MTTGIDCRVYVDGVRLPDGSVGDDPNAPTALSGLKVTWGRSTTLDQPDPASCTFDVMDLPGSRSFIQQFRTGITLDVYSTGIEAGSTVPAMVDPGFEKGPAGATIPAVVTNAAVTYSTRRASGTFGALISPADLTRQAAVGFPPAPLSPEFDAWDQVPATSVGDVWAFGATVRAPAGARIMVCPVYFPNPTGGGAIFDTANGQTVTGTGAFQHIDSAFVAATAGRWVGVGVLIDTWPRWVDVPGSWADQAGAVTRTNDAPNPVPGSTTGYALGGGGALAPMSDGTIAAEVTSNGSSTPYIFSTMAPGHYNAGESVVVSALVESDTALSFNFRAHRRTGNVYFANGQQIGKAIPAATPTRITIVCVIDQACDGDLDFSMVYSGATPGAGVKFRIAKVSIARGTAFTGYFDGSTPPAGGKAYRWTGAANASTSEEYTGGASWLDFGNASVDDLIVTPPAGGTPRTVSVFSGRITDLVADYDDGIGCPVVHVTAQDFTADLANIDVGDEPFLVESMKDRFLRIVALSGYDLATVIDDSVANTPVSYQDVDSQPVAGLLRDLAQSVDAVLWSAVHMTTGAYLRVEDPGNRAALFTLQMIGGKVQIVPRGSAAAVLDISACDVLRDPIQWEQSVSDVSTRVAVDWLEQTVDDKGKPTTNAHTLTLIDAALEVDYGTRRISTSTQLTTQADAVDVATRILARTGTTGWRISGFEIVDDASLDVVDAAAVSMMMRLLDGTSRIGLPIRIVDLPAWAPTAPTVGVYLEGGEYAFVAGTWDLSLTVSSAVAVGESVAWNQLTPSWRWVDFDPSIDWLDMVGVSPPA